MKTRDLTIRLLVDNTPEKAFEAIIDPRAWWSEEIEGETKKLNGEFVYHYKDVHYCKLQLIELIPARKVVYFVKYNYFQFTKDKSEWTGTKIIFEISRKEDQTEIVFTHQGLVPEEECYEICSRAWSQFVGESLLSLITTGKGQPITKEKDTNLTIINQLQESQQ